MRRLLVVPLVAAALALSPLTGCAAELGPGPAGPATALTLPARAPSTSADDTTGAAPPAADGDVAACADGDCEVRLTRDTVIRLDEGLDVESVTVSDITANRARVTLESGGSTSTSTGGVVQVVQGGLSARLTVQGGVALLRLSTS